MTAPMLSDEQIDAVARSLGISYGGREFDIRSIARACVAASIAAPAGEGEHVLRGIVKDALSAFLVTQRTEDYSAGHWSRRAVVLLAAAPAAPQASAPAGEGEAECPKSPDGLHSETWQDGEECSYCGASAMSNAERVKQGMEPVTHEARCSYGDLPGQPCNCRVSRLAASPAAPVPPADNPTNLPPALGETVHDALQAALTMRGYRADGDTVTLARRCHFMAMEDRDVIAMQRAIMDKRKAAAMPPADGGKDREHRELMLLAAADLESWMKSYHRDDATEGTVKRLRDAALAAPSQAGQIEPVATVRPAIDADTLFRLRRYLNDVLAEGTGQERVVAMTALRMIATPPAADAVPAASEPDLRADAPKKYRCPTVCPGCVNAPCPMNGAPRPARYNPKG